MGKLLEDEAYCIKCRGARQMVDSRFSRYKNNMPVLKGKCKDCGITVTKLLTREQALKEELKQQEQSDVKEGDPD